MLMLQGLMNRVLIQERERARERERETDEPCSHPGERERERLMNRVLIQERERIMKPSSLERIMLQSKG